MNRYGSSDSQITGAKSRDTKIISIRILPPGFVIREGPVPFPVTRTALLNEILAREQMVMQNIKERKRKHESAVAASNARKPGSYNKSTYANSTGKDRPPKGSAALISEAIDTNQAADANNKTGHSAARASLKTGNIMEAPRMDNTSSERNPATLNEGRTGNGDDDSADVVSVIDNAMNSKNLGRNISPPVGSSQVVENVTASIDRVAKNKPSPHVDDVRKTGKAADSSGTYKGAPHISGNTDRNPSQNNANSDRETREEAKNQSNSATGTAGTVSGHHKPTMRESRNEFE